MRAMILSAGRGERMRPLTDTCPKPLLELAGKPLIVRHLEKLREAGIKEVVVNSAWLSEKIVSFLGDGRAFGLSITHSVEALPGLETAGGIIRVLPFFKGENFLVINGDVLLDCDYAVLLRHEPPAGGAFLYLTANPRHNLKGDFSLSGREIRRGGDYTFTGAAVYTSAVFEGRKDGRLALRPVFDALIERHKLLGALLEGAWFDVGTPERLREAENYLLSRNI